MMILTFLTMIGNHPDTLCQVLVRSRQSSPVPITCQRLGREKWSRPDNPHRSGFLHTPIRKSIFRPYRLGIILNHMQMIHRGNLQNRVHITGLPEQMNGNDRLCIPGDRFFYLTGIDIISVRIHIHQDRRQPQQSNDLGCRHIRKCRNDHLIPRLQPQCHQSNLKRIRPVSTRDDMRNIQIFSQMITKSFHLRSIDKSAAFNHCLHRRIYLLFQAMILSLQIDHLYMFFKHLYRLCPFCFSLLLIT